MLDNGAVVNIKDNEGNTALHFSNRANISKALIKAGLSSNEKNFKNQTVLHLTRNAKNIEFLLEAGANVDVNDVDGKTPLQCNTSKGIKLILLDAEKRSRN